MSKNITILALATFLSIFVVWLFSMSPKETITVSSFEECVSAGNPVMESYPRQCKTEDKTFVEDIGNEISKSDMIRISSPRPNDIVKSPLTITGEARGNWFFEASFPIVLIDSSGKTIAEGHAEAKSDWMTSEFVPFEATLIFTVDSKSQNSSGILLLKKDNPSGLPQYEDSLIVPVFFIEPTTTPPPPVACTMDAKVCPDGTYVGRTGPKCEFTACPSKPNSGKSAGLNQRVFNSGIYITPLAVESDSRCPVDVTCIWAGEILLRIRLQKGDIIKDAVLSEGQSTKIDNTTITLISAKPSKKSTSTIKDEDYVFTFDVATVGGNNNVFGTVTLSPTCPVERNPPDPNCAPRKYQTSINIFKSGSSNIYRTILSDINGQFSTMLDVGHYVFKARGGNSLPSCPDTAVNVAVNLDTNVDISCDTGIR